MEPAAATEARSTSPGAYSICQFIFQLIKDLTSTDPTDPENMSYQRLACEEPKPYNSLTELKHEFEKEERVLYAVLHELGVLHRAPLLKLLIPRLERIAAKCVRKEVDGNLAQQKRFDDFTNMLSKMCDDAQEKLRVAKSSLDADLVKQLKEYKKAVVHVLSDDGIGTSASDEAIIGALLKLRTGTDEVKYWKTAAQASHVRLNIERGMRVKAEGERDDAEALCENYKVMYKSLDRYFNSINQVHQEAMEIHGAGPSSTANNTPAFPADNVEVASTVNKSKAAANANRLTVISERSEDDGSSISSGSSSTSSIGKYGSLSSGSRSIPIGIDGGIAEEYIKSLGGQDHARKNSNTSTIASGHPREDTMADFNAFAEKFDAEAKDTYERVTAGKHGRSKSF